jgi:hypothetical protein
MIGAPCDGAAESAAIAAHPDFDRLIERFPASPRTVVSIYERAAAP